MERSNKLSRVISLIVCLLIVSSIAIVRQGKLFGHDFGASAPSVEATSNDTVSIMGDGSIVVNTSVLAGDVTGFGGIVPLEITIKNDVVTDVKALDNEETPDFFSEASALFEQWKGKSVAEAASLKVDAVSGATYSSNAIIENMRRGLLYAANREEAEEADGQFDFTLKNIAGLVVVLMAAILPLFVKNKKYRLVQLALNVIVLGFWCGAFLSYTLVLGYAANGVDVLASIVPLVMLVTAFVYPLFGKMSYYCTNVCPFGSLQQLAGKCVKYKVKISPKTVGRLDVFRQVLWALLMLCIWGGVWSDWINYEPFSAFIFQTASWVVIALASLFVLLSLVVTRPYCRFVCPMGTLMKLGQGMK